MPQAVTTPPAQTAVLHDARAVHDCSRMALAALMANGRPVWLVLDIVPGERSGSATIPNAHIDADTGKLVMPPDSKTVVIKEGRWRVVASAQPPNRTEGQYSWTEPIEIKRTLDREDLYSPFVHGGKILSLLVSNADGIHEFGPITVLPDDFDRAVPGAFATATATPALLIGDNDLAAAHGFRTLLDAGQLSADSLHRAVASAQGYRLAILVTALLTARLQAELSDEAIRVTAEKRDQASVRMIALAVVTASYFGGPVANRPGNALMAALRQRLRESTPTRPTDPYGVALFSLLGQ